MMTGAHLQEQTRKVFWGELAPCDHVLQIYDEDKVFLDSLQGFICEGLDAGEAVIIIATASHREEMSRRLTLAGHDVDGLAASDRYIALSAQDTLDQFMVRGAPDEARFRRTINGVVERARRGGRGVRAFGEMVALLWARGNRASTVQLELMWNDLLRSQRFPLFCAYPRVGFTQEISSAIHAVCEAHTRIFGESQARAAGA
ncbi:MAG TPA: MEDS domain-containing protein [Usitatibacter sp.]|nr:MEDS domain-containing protein [Usitatibacter sp.]